MDKIDKIIMRAVKGIAKPTKEEMKFFDEWFKKEFGCEEQFQFDGQIYTCGGWCNNCLQKHFCDKCKWGKRTTKECKR